MYASHMAGIGRASWTFTRHKDWFLVRDNLSTHYNTMYWHWQYYEFPWP